MKLRGRRRFGAIWGGVALAMGVVLAACRSGGGGAGPWYVPAEPVSLRPVRAGLVEGVKSARALVVYGPPGRAVPGPDVPVLVLESGPAGGAAPAPRGEPVRRIAVGGGVVDLFTSAGRALAAEIHGVAGRDGFLRVHGQFEADVLERALGTLGAETKGAVRALVIRQPPAGLVPRYGPAAPPPGPLWPAGPGSFADYLGEGGLVTVQAIRDRAMPVAELAWGLVSGRLVDVGRWRAVEVPAGPGGRTLVWQPAPGIYLVVQAQGVADREVLAFAARLHAVSERRWKAYVEGHGLDWRRPGPPPDVTGIPAEPG